MQLQGTWHRPNCYRYMLHQSQKYLFYLSFMTTKRGVYTFSKKKKKKKKKEKEKEKKKKGVYILGHQE